MTKRSEAKHGLCIKVGDVTIKQEDPRNVVVAYKSNISYFGKLEQAIDYAIKLLTLNSGYYTDLNDFMAAYCKEQAKVMAAFDRLPF